MSSRWQEAGSGSCRCGCAQRRKPGTPSGSREGGQTGRGQAGALSSGSPTLAADGGITVEKEVSKDELLAVLKLYREARGAGSDTPRLLKILSQMEKNEVRGDRAPPSGGGGLRLNRVSPPTVHPHHFGDTFGGHHGKSRGGGEACRGRAPGRRGACSLCSPVAKHRGVSGTEIKDQK